MKSAFMRPAALALFTLFIAASQPSLARDRKLPMRDGPVMTAREAKTLVATAKTPKDHLKIARYFNQEAEQFESEARDHEELTAAYRKNPAPWAAQRRPARTIPRQGHSRVQVGARRAICRDRPG